MTVEQVKTKIQEMAQFRYIGLIGIVSKTALENNLYTKILEAIASGDQNPQQLAIAALESKNIEIEKT